VVDDEWGQDPSVRMMRQVFGRMETAQQEFLKRLNVSFFDARLKSWRKSALSCFEQSWARAAGNGMKMGEDAAEVIYIHCLAHAMGKDNEKIPPDILPGDKWIKKVIEEVEW